MIIKYKTGQYFPLQVIFPSTIFLLFALFFTYLGADDPWFFRPAVVFLFICTVGIFTTNGVYINPNADKYKTYINYLGLSWGKWKTLEDFTHVSVKVRTKANPINRLGNHSFTSSEKGYNLCLTSKQGKRILLKQFGNQEQHKIRALKEGKILATQLRLDFITDISDED